MGFRLFSLRKALECVRAERAGVPSSGLELRSGLRGKEVNADNVFQPLAFVTSSLMAGPNPACFCCLPLPVKCIAGIL